MAVWLVVWGRNPHDLRDKKVVEELKERIKKVELNFDFLAYFSLVNPIHNQGFDENTEFVQGINEYYKRKQSKFLNKESQIKKYNPDNWEIDENEGHRISFKYYFDDLNTINDKSIADSFKLFLRSNICCFIGDFDTFSKWFELCANSHEKLREGWQELIRTLFRLFDVKQAIYFSEWGFGDEDCESFDELLQWIEERPEKIIHKLEDLYKGDEFYIENLS
ncbi:hypothetical protein [Emticicia sp. C21]|uniref:hypothetical protein n=1 Tax=Emticicia sp. C21 TaxID=2302915 RepID=UPI000E353A35|nr:hypothetical protein [Emticicia sp. C21]RFS15084.1 hypothetical protein D0T08_18580 [Emticicia sp. C21]